MPSGSKKVDGLAGAVDGQARRRHQGPQDRDPGRRGGRRRATRRRSRTASKREGAVVEVIADHGGTITCSLGKAVEGRPPGAERALGDLRRRRRSRAGASAAKLAKTGLALAFLAEAFKHGKPLAFVGDASALIGSGASAGPTKGRRRPGRNDAVGGRCGAPGTHRRA